MFLLVFQGKTSTGLSSEYVSIHMIARQFRSE